MDKIWRWHLILSNRWLVQQRVWGVGSAWNLGLLVLCIGLNGCMSTGEKTTFDTDLISLTSVVDSVFGEGSQDSLRNVSKTIRVNKGNPETKNLENYDVKNDLDKLKDFDVATPRWAGFMESTSRDSAGFTFIRYTTENEKAPVRFITLVREDDKIISIDVHSEKKTLVSDQEMSIEWNVGSGYSIERTSQLLFRKPSVFQMDVRYQ